MTDSSDPDPTQSTYAAHPLNTSSSPNIRLLSVQHDTWQDPGALIFCTLCVVPLSTAPPYTALSYVWGEGVATRFIVLDGRPFWVRDSLWAFLAQWRNSGTEVGYVWIDALCINQLCVEERNHQVALMGEIYSRAWRVVAWLDGGLEGALNRLVEEADVDVDVEMFIRDLMALCSDEYWRRLWIVQEYVLGQSVSIWAGAARTSSDALPRLFTRARWSNVFGSKINNNLTALQFSPAHNIVSCRTAHWDDPNTSPRWVHSSQLFEQFKQAKCLDARDRVYGLLGLIRPQELAIYPIDPDYSKTPSQLLWELYLRREKQLPYVRDYQRSNFVWQGLDRYVACLQMMLGVHDSDPQVLAARDRYD
ncbi:hypothetical protein CC86DRAFT_365605 [Ophiobolus disseminans]|uniref:Heterokaryon incompatibility domain-containing protein n=1 Tax=Ophiobolus disseminans TaxID=1469910 RepID=A0A6A7AKJ1_9PLEO|nr:hypothetical protein CC86DRAFT_365605 [Ophiobolus disseminans]